MNQEKIITSINELYGNAKPKENDILLLTSGELLAITDILRDITTDRAVLKKIDALEKPHKKNINKT